MQPDTDEQSASSTVVLPRLPASEVTEQAPAPGPDLGHWLHTGFTLAAVMGLAVGTRAVWSSYAVARPHFAVTITGVYLVMLVSAVLALCVRSTRSLVRIDVTVLGAAIVLRVLTLWPAMVGERKISVDEGVLMDLAARALANGQNPYAMSWPHLADLAPPTRLMNGGTADNFGYPPFGVEVGALLQKIAPSFVGVVLLATLALVASAIIIFRMAPTPLRPLATLGVLGLGTLIPYARSAYPSLIALPLLCLAVWKWPSIGKGGRLGWTGILRAVALGLALATHQLGWFLAVFLVVGLLLLRRGELPWKATVVLLVRYAAFVAAPFFLVSLPFLIRSPGDWLSGITEPLTQHAVPHGQGIMDVSYYLVGGSGGLDFYGHASTLLLLGMLAAFAVRLRWLGRAAVALPWLLFAVSTRSQDGYFLLTMPLWIAGLVSTTSEDFAGAYRIPFPGRRLGALATAAFFLPAAACVVIAMVSPQPLTMRTSALRTGQSIESLTVDVTNRSSHSITPSFGLTTGTDIGSFWTVTSGPPTIPAHGSAIYLLKPPTKSWRPAKTSFLRVVSDDPQTLSSLKLGG